MAKQKKRTAGTTQMVGFHCDRKLSDRISKAADKARRSKANYIRLAVEAQLERDGA